jgi:phosphate uptake regulator
MGREAKFVTALRQSSTSKYGADYYVSSKNYNMEHILDHIQQIAHRKFLLSTFYKVYHITDMYIHPNYL